MVRMVRMVRSLADRTFQLWPAPLVVHLGLGEEAADRRGGGATNSLRAPRAYAAANSIRPPDQINPSPVRRRDWEKEDIMIEERLLGSS